jgi:hypothetical protein
MDPQSGNDIIKKYAVRKMANANITILNIKLSITKIMLDAFLVRHAGCCRRRIVHATQNIFCATWMDADVIFPYRY